MAVCSKTYIIRKGKSNMRKRICKKAASLALALAMAVSVCTTALAEGDTEQTTTETTSISEQTKGNGGEDGPSTKAVENGATLTLDEFNALTAIPANVTELTVNLDGVDLRNGSVVVAMKPLLTPIGMSTPWMKCGKMKRSLNRMGRDLLLEPISRELN